MKRAFIYFLLLCILPLKADAESAKWSVKPRYTSIANFGKGLFKVKSGGRVGILDNKGKEVVPVTADSITNPSEGYSLVLKKEEKEDKLRLTAIIDAYGLLKPINKEWYVDEYPFFSDGLLPVCTKKGKYGYIDVNGNIEVPFEYGSVHPFCEGLAAVSKSKTLLDKGLKLFGSKKKDKVFYIQKNGTPLDLQSDIGDIYLATSFSDGKALVINMNEKRFIIDHSGHTVSMVNSSVQIEFNEKYALRKEGEKVIPQLNSDDTSNGPVAYKKKFYYGYKYKGQIVLPPQFIYAENFSNGYAIALAQTGYGVLQLINNDVECKSTESIEDKGKKAINYIVTVPPEWNSGTLEMRCKNSNGVETSVQGEKNSNSWCFHFVISDEESVFTLIGKDTNGELILWNSLASVKLETSIKQPSTLNTPNKKHTSKGHKKNKKDKKDKKDSKKKGVFF